MNSHGQLPNFTQLLNNIRPIQPPTTVQYVAPHISNNQNMDNTYNSLMSSLQGFNEVNNYLIYLIQENSQKPDNHLIYQFNQQIEQYPQHFTHVHEQLIGLYNMVNGPKPTDGLMIAMRNVDKQFTQNSNLQPDQSVPDQIQPDQNIPKEQPNQAEQQAAQTLGQLHTTIPQPLHVHFSQPSSYKLPFPSQTATIPVAPTSNGQALPTPTSPQSINSSQTKVSPPTTSAQTPTQPLTPPLSTPSPRAKSRAFGKRATMVPHECAHCHKHNTPEWRKGPDDVRNLCNACGIFFAKLLRTHGPELAKIILIVKQDRGENRDCSKDRSLPRQLEVESYVNLYNAKYLQHVPA